MLDLKLEKVKLMDLIPREGNPNQMTDDQVDSLGYSIHKFGYLQPIVVDQNNNIVDGFHRFLALKEKGFHQEIDVVRVNLETEEDLKLLSQTMNKLRGSHNLQKDISEMEVLMGYKPDELQSLLGFGETGLDLMRQAQAMEQEQITNINSLDDDSNKKDVEFKAKIKHECPSCGHIF